MSASGSRPSSAKPVSTGSRRPRPGPRLPGCRPPVRRVPRRPPGALRTQGSAFPLRAEEARTALAEGVQACEVCRPDRVLTP
ncbi:DUF6233 domain-containing protein [Streptomyces californicus]|uniref:DUF6233 domain-containing protein n=1 Tax=Streptomyces californicus TaxID=67351 RepID=UPI00379C0B29